jgi:hypothetical protein
VSVVIIVSGMVIGLQKARGNSSAVAPLK